MDLSTGLSLIELMIVLVIVGVLTAMAMPVYTRHVQRAARLEAIAVLLDASQFMQRFYNTNNSFSTDLTGKAIALPAALRQSPGQGAVRYTIAIQPLADSTLSASNYAASYVLIVTPQGNQSNDGCGTLTLNHVGVQSASLAGNNAGALSACWR
jgi:type IV pilus assembly protein PilE